MNSGGQYQLPGPACALEYLNILGGNGSIRVVIIVKWRKLQGNCVSGTVELFTRDRNSMPRLEQSEVCSRHLINVSHTYYLESVQTVFPGPTTTSSQRLICSPFHLPRILESFLFFLGPFLMLHLVPDLGSYLGLSLIPPNNKPPLPVTHSVVNLREPLSHIYPKFIMLYLLKKRDGEMEHDLS
jgi:hypothetical protein